MKWICKKQLSFLLKDSIYYIDIIISKYDDPDNIFTDYLEIFDLDQKYLGGFWIDIDKYFTKLSDWREIQINKILEDEAVSEDSTLE